MGYTVSPSTDNARNNNNTRAQTRAWPTKALYCSLKCTRLATVCSPVTTGSSKIRRTATSPQELAEQRSQRPTAERRTFAPRLAPTDEP